MIVLTALNPLRVINSLPFDTKIFKIGEKMLCENGVMEFILR
jgi:hypothetical protein